MIETILTIGPGVVLGAGLLVGVVAAVRGLGAEPPAEFNAWPDELWRQL